MRRPLNRRILVAAAASALIALVVVLVLELAVGGVAAWAYPLAAVLAGAEGGVLYRRWQLDAQRPMDPDDVHNHSPYTS